MSSARLSASWSAPDRRSRFYEDRDSLRWDCLPIKGVTYRIGSDMNGMVGDAWKVMIDDEPAAILFKLYFGHAVRLWASADHAGTQAL
jgi:hypothetical protein